MADRMARWTGDNYDEISALTRPAGPCPPTLTWFDGRLIITNSGERTEVMPGDIVSRGALGELHVFPAVPVTMHASGCAVWGDEDMVLPCTCGVEAGGVMPLKPMSEKKLAQLAEEGATFPHSPLRQVSPKTEPLDLAAIVAEWQQQCGPHDYGITGGTCGCPPGDPRPVISRLIAEIQRLRSSSKRFTDPSVTEAMERELRSAMCETGCVDCLIADNRDGRPCWRHLAQHLVDAMREERLVVLTIEAADEIIRTAWDGKPEGVS
jgi:hypothetical protein